MPGPMFTPEINYDEAKSNLQKTREILAAQESKENECTNPDP
jgi:hypothetical protein